MGVEESGWVWGRRRGRRPHRFFIVDVAKKYVSNVFVGVPVLRITYVAKLHITSVAVDPFEIMFPPRRG
jgi:hypothetical protein